MNNQNKSFHKFFVLWSGEFISAIGSGLSSFGLGVYVYQQTGKASAMALVTLLAFLPFLLLSAPSGVLADRYDRRLLMILGDSLSVVGLGFILICMLQGEAQLWQICVGVTISSVFASLLEPAYKATVTDLLTEEEYSKASGLVQIAGSSKYLISPIIAGFLLTITDIKFLLILDICTFFVTVTTTLVVRKGLTSKKHEKVTSFLQEFKEGWNTITENKGVLLLVIIASVITLFLGFIQVLSAPMILAFSNSSALGTMETISASGMLVSGVILGILPIKRGFVRMLSVSLFFAGLSMAMFGLRENIFSICIFGFMFFAMLPFAQTSLDYLVRTNIDNSAQGRAWGLIGLISQIGYIVAYSSLGILADYVFTPMLKEHGILASSVGRLFGTGNGRGTGFLISVAGLLLCITAFLLYQIKSIQELEKREVTHVLQNNPQ
jgi:Major Facilitator Superfamily.